MEHRPRLAEDLDDQRVVGTHLVGPRDQPARRRRAGQVDVLLDGDGQAVQRADGPAVLGQVRVQSGGVLERGVEHDVRETVGLYPYQQPHTYIYMSLRGKEKPTA